MSHVLRADPMGFHLRGRENTRIEAFTDAAFAFAVTLLMIGGGHVPVNIAELIDAVKGVPGYAASFALLCLFWHAHYIWYRRYGVEDGRSVVLSLVLVFLVLIYVYPLRMMFTAAFMSVGGRAAPGAFVPQAWSDMQAMFVIFGVAYASMSGVLLLFYLHARKLGADLGLDAGEIEITRAGILRWSINAGVGLASGLLALAIPPYSPGIAFTLPGLTYWVLVLSGPLLRRRLRLRLAALAAHA